MELEFGVLNFVDGGTPENPEKIPRSKDENQQQTQPWHSGGGERSHHCAIPASPHKHMHLKALTSNQVIYACSVSLS